MGSTTSIFLPPKDYSKSNTNVKGLTNNNIPGNIDVTRVVVITNLITFAHLGSDIPGGHMEVIDNIGVFANGVATNFAGSTKTNDL